MRALYAVLDELSDDFEQFQTNGVLDGFSEELPGYRYIASVPRYTHIYVPNPKQFKTYRPNNLNTVYTLNPKP